MWTSRVGSDARIDQLEGRSPESCLSWLRSHEGCPKNGYITVSHYLSRYRVMASYVLMEFELLGRSILI